VRQSPFLARDPGTRLIAAIENSSTKVWARDQESYLRWVFEAKKCFGLSVLNYAVTCNHVHLLVKDTGPNVIAASVQLIAGRTGQEYNQRKRPRRILGRA
jgi:hypothetical protein